MEFRARWYQKAFHQALVGDACDRAIAVWHRRAGKDEIVLHGFRDLSIRRIGTYWHCLPRIRPGPQGALDRDQRPHRQAPDRRDLPARMPRDDARAGDVHPVQMGQHLAADRLGRL